MTDEETIAALRRIHEAFNRRDFDAVVQHYEPLDFRVNGDKVVERVHVMGRGAGSGIEVDFVTYAVWTLDDHGLVTKAQGFLPHEEAEALEAVGLSE
jgi:hypothetical protein